MYKIDDVLAKEIKMKLLHAAMKNHTPHELFLEHDKDNEGTLSSMEFKKLIRVGLDIPPLELPDVHIKLLMGELDEDGGGSISALELENFLHH